MRLGNLELTDSLTEHFRRRTEGSRGDTCGARPSAYGRGSMLDKVRQRSRLHLMRIRSELRLFVTLNRQ